MTRALALVASMAFLAASPASAQQVWLSVRGPDARPKGVTDWDALFKPTPEWSAVAAKIQVFGISAGNVVQSSDEDLKAIAADLASHHIAIALAMQSIGIGPGDKCGHEEGYGVPAFSARAAEKLHRLGIPLQYLSMDEPVWFGHYAPGPQGCQFSVPELARRVALNAREYVRYFPNMTFGDIEPIPGLNSAPDWKPVFQSFAREIARDTGRPVTFLQTDVNWRVPSFETSIQQVAAFAHAEGLKFGLIVNADGGDDSGPAWVAAAVHHFELVEDELGVTLDQAMVASWDPYPTHVLPDTAPGSLSHVIEQILLPPTRLTAVREGQGVSGRLTDQHGAPIVDARVTVRTSGFDGMRPPTVHSVSGIVPNAARFAIIGLRVNADCLCDGSNDLLVGGMHYAEGPGGTAVQTYDMPEEVARRKGLPLDGIKVTNQTIGGHAFAHLVVGPDQHFGANSPMFAVTPGAHFDFDAALKSIPGKGMFGAAIIVWLDDAHHGLHLAHIYLGREGVAVGSAVTAADGRFRVSGAAQQAALGSHLEIEYSGDAQGRGTLLMLR